MSHPLKVDCKVYHSTSWIPLMYYEIFSGIGEKLLPTKAAPIASLNLSIIRWPLSKNITLEQKLQNHRLQIESCAKQQI